MDKKILAIGAVVVIVAAAAAVFMMNPGSDDKFSPSEYPAYLTVLGNADLDNDIDYDDVTKIQDFLDSGEPLDYGKHYMMDTNFDGTVDGKDVDMVSEIIIAQTSSDWSKVGKVHYVNVDLEIATYDMTKSNKVITLIAPPLDSVLALGGKELVVGFDNRITVGKYHSEYGSTFDFSNMYDVGNCNTPDTEVITQACRDLGSVNVVCGTRDAYGPNLESTYEGTDVQVIRIASWEYGGTLYGFMTLGFLLKMNDGAKDYYDWYTECNETVKQIVASVDGSKKSEGMIGAAAAYGYTDELSLLGNYTGEYANLMVLDPYDSAEDYLHGKNSGGHGDTIGTEGVLAMYQQNHLKHLLLMIGTPFQVKIADGDAQASQKSIINLYDSWGDRIGTDTMPELSYCITGFSFSSGVSEVLNQMILCYYLYNEEFLAYFGASTQDEAKDILAGYVDHYCESIGIDDLWSFYGGEHGGKAGTYGMNLLYCGEGSELNIMYGLPGGSI